MKTGIVLPSFQDHPDLALEVARQAEEAGVDGVFCYDHLWPMGRPDRPAIAPFPLLAAIARMTTRVCVGTLVARIGLVPDAVLCSEFAALDWLAPGRVIAGLGTGDRLSAAENVAYGIAFDTPHERRESLVAVARELRGRGIAVWIGGGAARTVAVAEDQGVALNLWGATPAVVADQTKRTEVTWAGPTPTGLDGHVDEAATGDLVSAVAAAGATWAVFGWPAPLEVLVAGSGRSAGRR